ncbi:hypothetical protein ACJX0J_012332, partial [Zea mays]
GLKFSPKVPQKKLVKVVSKSMEPVEESKEEDNKYSSTRIKSEEKSKSGTKVAFGQGNSSYARYFPMPKKDSSAGGTSKLPKEYAEPWDYTHDYHVTLPLLWKSWYIFFKVLDEEEFGESSASRTEDDKLPYA